jgi:hypothetical protein
LAFGFGNDIRLTSIALGMLFAASVFGRFHCSNWFDGCSNRLDWCNRLGDCFLHLLDLGSVVFDLGSVVFDLGGRLFGMLGVYLGFLLSSKRETVTRNYYLGKNAGGIELLLGFWLFDFFSRSLASLNSCESPTRVN